MNDLKPLDLFNVPLNGISLVEASAGTGKTYNIASLYVRAILELNLEPSQILVMTFTEAATAELKSRLRDRIKDSLSIIKGDKQPKDDFFESLISANFDSPEVRLKNALDTFDEAAVFTIHGFCNRLLTEYSVQFDVPPNVELLTNTDELLQECIDEYWLEFNRKSNEGTYQWFVLNYLIDHGFGPDKLKDILDEVVGQTNTKVVPEVKLKGLKPMFIELKNLYFSIKEQWNDEKNQLKEILFCGHLNGRRFKKDKLNDYWDVLEAWIEKEGFSFKYAPELEKFSLYLYDSFNKNAPEFEVLDICRSIDRFIELVEKFALVKVAFINESVDVIQGRFRALKKVRQVLSYDDMLTKVEEGLKPKTAVSLRERLAEKYPFALVDEFQDTDQIQYNILKHIYNKRPSTGLFMIGDPKQAIYSFRGADVYTYLEAKSHLTNDQAYGLTANFRSNKDMIEGVNQLFSGPQNSFIDSEIQFQKAKFPDGKGDKNYLYNNSGVKLKPLQFLTLDKIEYSNKASINEDIYSALTREILELLSGNYKVRVEDSDDLQAVEEKHIAILVWKGSDGEKIQSVLRDVGIKSVLRSNTSVFSTEESSDLFRVLNAIQNLSYEPGIKAALVTSLIGYSAMDIKNLDDKEEEWADLVSSLTDIRDSWNKFGIESALDLFFELFGVFESLSRLKNAERKISNLLHLAELLSKESRVNRFNPNALIRWYHSKLSDDNGSIKAKDEEQMRLESDDELVQITTMHSSKGLQYPIVFCPFLWSSKVITENESVIKFKKDSTSFIDLSGGIQHENKSEYLQIARDQNKAEDVRLAYVSLTRSISACYVFLPNYDKIHNSPISYILNGKDRSDTIDFNSIRSALETKEQIQVRKPVIELKTKIKNDSEDNEKLKAETLKRNDLFLHPKMLSYSTLVGAHSDNGTGKDYDKILLDRKGTDGNEPGSINRFSFPKGANAGSFLHQIFEDISFQKQNSIEVLVNDNLNRFGFDGQWGSMVSKWVSETLGHNLGIADVSLSDLPDKHVIKEMEFFFPVNDLQISEIWRLIRLRYNEANNHELYHGFLKGFIDLIFFWKGKYYILDYKSNYLGNSVENYKAPALKNAVMDAGYDLQYHLYTLALERYLHSRIVDYNYDEHFGGVLYLFLRGIDNTKPGSGVFYDRPDAQLIQKLNETVRGGGS